MRALLETYSVTRFGIYAVVFIGMLPSNLFPARLSVVNTGDEFWS